MRSLSVAIAIRLAAFVPVLFGVVFLIFVAIDIAPGDPATAVLGTFASPEERAEFAERNGLNDPLPIRFVRFLVDVSRGELGTSMVRSETVANMIARALPVTLQLTFLALLIGTTAAVALGVLAAIRRNGWVDRVVQSVSSAALAAPDFWLGILAIQFIAVGLGVLPSGGYVSMGEGFVLWLRSMILPASVLAVPLAGSLTRLIRVAVADELDKDYVRTARGVGLSLANVLGLHVMRNAAIAPLTVLGVRAGQLLSGAIIVEAIYNIPGLGTILIDGVRQGDLGPVRGTAIVATVAFLAINVVIDAVHVVLNPKLRQL
jgi:peptide/nickel transport system permease protein